jgi:hypothetical protein
MHGGVIHRDKQVEGNYKKMLRAKMESVYLATFATLSLNSNYKFNW